MKNLTLLTLLTASIFTTASADGIGGIMTDMMDIPKEIITTGTDAMRDIKNSATDSMEEIKDSATDSIKDVKDSATDSKDDKEKTVTKKIAEPTPEPKVSESKEISEANTTK